MTIHFTLVVMLIFVQTTIGTHFYGGTINWSPENSLPAEINGTLPIIIEQRYAWSTNTMAGACTSSTILSHGLIGDVSSNTLTCLSNSTICSRTNFTANISTLVPCTDYNTMLDMSSGSSRTSVAFNVLSNGLVIGYTSSGDGWIPLQLGGGNWSLVMYLNLEKRPDNNLVNHSPTSSISIVNYVPITGNTTIAIDIPMSDSDGDRIECRFAKSNNTLSETVVDECQDVCSTIALPSSATLVSINNTCTLYVTLSSVGQYAVAIQLEDFLGNSTAILSSVPFQFILIAVDTSNSSDNCTLQPTIIDIRPGSPSYGSTITVQMNVSYTFTVIVETACVNNTQVNITNFITSSPSGMLQTDPYEMTPTLYATDHTWIPTSDQLNQIFTFCTIAVDNNFYSSKQYCFNLFVNHQIELTSYESTSYELTTYELTTYELITSTTTTTTSTTTTSTTSTTTTSETTTTATTTSTTTTTTTTSATTTTTTSATTTTTTSTTSTTTTSTTSTTTTSTTSTTTTSTTSTTTTSATTTTTTSTTSTTTTTTSTTSTTSTTTTTTSTTSTTTTTTTTTSTTTTTTTTTTSETTTTTTTTSTTSTTTTTTTTTSTTSTTTTTTTTTSTTATTSTTSTTTSVTTTTVTIGATGTSSNNISLILGLAIGLGLPLLILIGILTSCYLCSCCLHPLMAIMRFRYGDRNERIVPEENKFVNQKIIHNLSNENFENTNNNSLQNINDISIDSTHLFITQNEKPEDLSLNHTKDDDRSLQFELGPWTATTTSFVSPSIDSLPTECVIDKIAPPLRPPILFPQHTSIIVEAYRQQKQHSEN